MNFTLTQARLSGPLRVGAILATWTFSNIYPTVFASRADHNQNPLEITQYSAHMVDTNQHHSGKPSLEQLDESLPSKDDQGVDPDQNLTTKDLIALYNGIDYVIAKSNASLVPTEQIDLEIHNILDTIRSEDSVAEMSKDLDDIAEIALILATATKELRKIERDLLNNQQLDKKYRSGTILETLLRHGMVRKNCVKYLRHVLSMEREEALKHIRDTIKRLILYKRRLAHSYFEFAVENHLPFNWNIDSNPFLNPETGFLADADDIPESCEDAVKTAHILVKLYDQYVVNSIRSKNDFRQIRQYNAHEITYENGRFDRSALYKIYTAGACGPYRESFLKSLLRECKKRDFKNRHGINDRMAAICDMLHQTHDLPQTPNNQPPTLMYNPTHYGSSIPVNSNPDDTGILQAISGLITRISSVFKGSHPSCHSINVVEQIQEPHSTLRPHQGNTDAASQRELLEANKTLKNLDVTENFNVATFRDFLSTDVKSIHDEISTSVKSVTNVTPAEKRGEMLNKLSNIVVNLGDTIVELRELEQCITNEKEPYARYVHYIKDILNKPRTEQLMHIRDAIKLLIVHKRELAYEYFKFAKENYLVWRLNELSGPIMDNNRSFLSDTEDIPESNQEQEAKKMACLLADIFDQMFVDAVQDFYASPVTKQQCESMLRTMDSILARSLKLAVTKDAWGKQGKYGPYKLSFIKSLLNELIDRDFRNEKGISNRFVNLLKLYSHGSDRILQYSHIFWQNGNREDYKVLHAIVEATRRLKVAKGILEYHKKSDSFDIINYPFNSLDIEEPISASNINADNLPYWTENCASLYVLLLLMNDMDDVPLPITNIDWLITLSENDLSQHFKVDKHSPEEKSLKEYYILRQILLEELLSTYLLHLKRDPKYYFTNIESLEEGEESVHHYNARQKLIGKIQEQLKKLSGSTKEESTNYYIKKYIEANDVEDGKTRVVTDDAEVDSNDEGRINEVVVGLLQKLRGVLIDLAGSEGPLEEVIVLDEVLLKPRMKASIAAQLGNAEGFNKRNLLKNICNDFMKGAGLMDGDSAYISGLCNALCLIAKFSKDYVNREMGIPGDASDKKDIFRRALLEFETKFCEADGSTPKEYEGTKVDPEMVSKALKVLKDDVACENFLNGVVSRSFT